MAGRENVKTFDEMIATHKSANVGQRPIPQPHQMSDEERAQFWAEFERETNEALSQKFRPGVQFAFDIEDADDDFSVSFTARFVRWVDNEGSNRIAEFDNGVKLISSTHSHDVLMKAKEIPMNFAEAIKRIDGRDDLELSLYIGDGAAMTLDELQKHFETLSVVEGENVNDAYCVDVYRKATDDIWWIGKIWWPHGDDPGSVHEDLVSELLEVGAGLQP